MIQIVRGEGEIGSDKERITRAPSGACSAVQQYCQQILVCVMVTYACLWPRFSLYFMFSDCLKIIGTISLRKFD